LSNDGSKGNKTVKHNRTKVKESLERNLTDWRGFEEARNEVNK